MKNDPEVPSDARSEKKPYVEPSVAEIPLRLDEAVLGFCKNPGVGPAQSDCSSSYVCSAAGS